MSKNMVATYGDARLPRYTSYPTAPQFSDAIGAMHYADWLQQTGFGTTSLYLHIPFCRSMCWYCGCHTTITERDRPILDYLDVLHREVDLVADRAPTVLDIRDIHFGGGTPTIIKPDEFSALVGHLRQRFGVHREANISVEIDPRTLSTDMASALGMSGVRRASLGVQSFDPVVQKAINRIQSAEQTDNCVRQLRAEGIARINFDLIYGLPHQTVSSCIATVKTALVMRPDRLSVFGYAHIPSFKKHQRLIDETVLPGASERIEQAEAIAAALVSAGYLRIGIDHFALPDDELALAAIGGTLRRNFQGYTTDQCDNLLGLGASAIGKLSHGYVQNAVAPGLYAKRIAEGSLPTAKGYRFTREDLMRSQLIERLMCDFSVDVPTIAQQYGFPPEPLLDSNDTLRTMQADGIITIEAGKVTLCGEHRFLVRAVAAAFDAYLGNSGRTFSQAA
ncbi:oxygen-independent coproporphyrinogen III oxidase [Rhizobium alvei]|uniref:Coproporphyrinogen-III oxidase n=1 Tax=Rhizobium alvei TaxID=1132659 RepID=A0ABT8YT66_9HYPH|nr:oxygen-independent coproporphyrinogen III oxidase [Rhizobium alvei]MDO6966884.1 oxygen-independent coproporphyrinogen III oxidase [Rhizobium alvei]